MRQPQARNASGEVHSLSPTKSRLAMMKPTGAPSWGERAPDGAFALRGVLGGQQGRARPFAAEADALSEAQEDEAQGSQNDPARGRGGRQQADEEGAD